MVSRTHNTISTYRTRIIYLVYYVQCTFETIRDSHCSFSVHLSLGKYDFEMHCYRSVLIRNIYFPFLWNGEIDWDATILPQREKLQVLICHGNANTCDVS